MLKVKLFDRFYVTNVVDLTYVAECSLGKCL